MSFFVYNIVFTAIVSIAVITGIVVYFVLLDRHLRKLQQTIMFETERLRITIAQALAPSYRSVETRFEEFGDANGEKGPANVPQHEESGEIEPPTEQADDGEGDRPSSITQP